MVPPSTINPNRIVLTPSSLYFANSVKAEIARARDDINSLFAIQGRPLSYYGEVDTTGATNMTPLINTAIAGCAADGVPLIIGPGDYLNNSNIVLVSNATVICSPLAIFIRNFGSSTASPHVASFGWPSAIENVRWYGGWFQNNNTAVQQGNVFTLHINDSKLCGFYIDDWADNGRAMYISGNRNRIFDFDAVSILDGGGIRLEGAVDTIVSNAYVTCGDDCFMFAAAGLTTSPFHGVATERCQYVNCTGYSWNARVCIAALTRVGLDPILTTSITDNAFIGIRGRGRRGAAVGNTLSSGKVARIRFIACHFDDSGAVEGGDESISIFSDAGTGGVEDITFEACSVLGPFLSAVSAGGPETRHIIFNSCYFDASRNNNETIIVGAYPHVEFHQCRVLARNNRDAILVGGSAINECHFVFKGGSIENIADGYAGINIATAGYAVVEDVQFIEASGATTAVAIEVQTGASDEIYIGRNDYRGLTIANKFVYPTSSSPRLNVNSSEIRNISASIALYPQENGATIILNDTTNRTITLPAARYGARYRFIQANTGNLILDCAAGDFIRIGTTLSSDGGTLTGGARGDYVELVCGDDVTWLAVFHGGTWTAT